MKKIIGILLILTGISGYLGGPELFKNTSPRENFIMDLSPYTHRWPSYIAHLRLEEFQIWSGTVIILGILILCVKRDQT